MIATIRWSAYAIAILAMLALGVERSTAGAVILGAAVLVVFATYGGLDIRRWFFGTPDEEARCARIDAELEEAERTRSR